MYFPKFVIKNNGVPILSKKELEIMAENFLKDFKTETLIKPQAIDIDDFAFNYLGLKLDFHHLSHDESILGAMVFDDTVIPVYNPESNKAEYSVIDKETVVIDSKLAEEHQERRYRYTVGHEVGHAIFHRKYFKHKSHISYYDEKNLKLVQEAEETFSGYKSVELWEDKDFVEWQANYFSAALLMPRSMIVKVLMELPLKDKDLKEEEYVYAVTKIFQVSWEAAANRLNSLGIIKNADRVKSRKSIFLDFAVDF